MRALNICIVSTTSHRSRTGNRITALRWARILKRLGHRVRIEPQYRGRKCDLMIALHAGRSRPSVLRFRRAYPTRPLILALTGTDLYGDIHTDPAARDSLKLATCFLTLQPLGIRQLPEKLRPRAVPIIQSALPPRHRRRPRADVFEVCVLGHLRPVKDPFRAAEATRYLPERSRIRVLHLGGALSPEMRRRALRESSRNSRYHWMGEVSHAKTLHFLSGCRLLVLTSRFEGGANVVAEALACDVPVLSSKIDASVGLLGPKYPGYFPAGDTRGLARLLSRSENDPRFFARLRKWCRARAQWVQPKREEDAWRKLLRRLQLA